MKETSSSAAISPRLQRIAKLAKDAPTMALSTLAHHIDIDWMGACLTRRPAVIGEVLADGRTRILFEDGSRLDAET